MLRNETTIGEGALHVCHVGYELGGSCNARCQSILDSSNTTKAAWPLLDFLLSMSLHFFFTHRLALGVTSHVCPFGTRHSLLVIVGHWRDVCKRVVW